MTATFVRITPDVVFSADVFPKVDVSPPDPRPRKRTIVPDEPLVDPRQVDLWGSDLDLAPTPI